MKSREFTPEELFGPLDEVEAKNAPKKLYLQGDVSLITKGARVALVGSRKASERGLARAYRLAKLLAELGVVVVSGLAAGIDTAAHLGALENDGRTIGVLGTGLDDAYPAKNRELQDAMGREHLLVTQFPSGTSSAPRNFPIRNRTMALISDATVIVEAGESSGTLHQGWEALRLGRPLFIMESVFEAGRAWALEMTRYGAERLSDDTLNLFFELLPEGSRVERAEATF